MTGRPKFEQSRRGSVAASNQDNYTEMTVRKSASGSLPRLRAAQAVLAAVLAVGAALAFTQPAQAATKSLVTDRDNEAWYWSSNQDVRACTPTTLPGPGLCGSQNITAAGPISPGHLGISWKNGSSDMRAYTLFDLSFIPTGSTVNSFVVTYTVSRADSADTAHTQEHAGAKPPATQNVTNSAMKVRACIVKVAWGATEGAPPQDRDPQDPTHVVPTEPAARNGVDEDTCVEGKGTAAKWSCDLASFAQKWVSGEVFNNGSALEPEGAQTDNRTLQLHGAFYENATSTPTGDVGNKVFVSHREEAKARIDYVPAVAAPSPPPPPPPPPPAPAPIPGPSTIEPALPTNVPTPAPVATPQLPVAQSKPTTPWYTWLVLPVGLVGFVGLSRAIGTEGGAANINQVAEVLRRRRNRLGD